MLLKFSTGGAFIYHEVKAKIFHSSVGTIIFFRFLVILQNMDLIDLIFNNGINRHVIFFFFTF